MLTILTLALVGGRAVTNRDVYVDLFTQPENVSALKKNLSPRKEINFDLLKNLEEDTFDASLNKIMTQMMIVEESKIVGTLKVQKSDIDKRLGNVRTAWGPENWAQIVRYFELSDSELRDRIEKNLLVDLTLENRVKIALVGETTPAKKSEMARAALEDWLSQLRSRYRIQYLKPKKQEQTKSEAR